MDILKEGRKRKKEDKEKGDEVQGVVGKRSLVRVVGG